jgi:CHAT domain-containing protein/tetratricopeptide (TPR) repeat protein
VEEPKHISELLVPFVQALSDGEALRLLDAEPRLATVEAFDTLKSWLPLNTHDPEVREVIVSRLQLIRARVGEEALERGSREEAVGTGADEPDDETEADLGWPQADEASEEARALLSDPRLEDDDPGVRLTALEAALQAISALRTPQLRAALELERGVCYLESEHAGPAMLDRACEVFRGLVDDAVRLQAPDIWASALNDLALALLRRQSEDREADVREAISLLRRTLEVRSPEETPHPWVQTQRNLGLAWSLASFGDTEENLRRSLEAYEATYAVYDRDWPVPWSETTNGMAAVLLESRAGSREDNLRRAIELYESVLELWDDDDPSPEWIEAANGLAVACSQAVQGDLVFHKERAIQLFRKVVETRAEGSDRLAWAEAQTNLANAHATRIRGDAVDNLRRAVDAFERALVVLDRRDHTYRWARTSIGLANALHELARVAGEEGAFERDLLDRCVETYRQVLQEVKAEWAPEDWATACENLANVLDDRKAAGDAEEALGLLSAAQTVYDRGGAPWTWARMQNTRGVVLAGQGRDDEAIAAFSDALDVFDVGLAPDSHRRAARNAGDLHFRQRRWENAWRHYETCLRATDLLSQAGETSESRQRQRMEEMDVPARAAYCLARKGCGREAVEVLERVKTRLLSETFRPADAAPAATREERERIRHHRGEIRRLEIEARDAYGSDEYVAVSAELGRVRRELATALRRKEPAGVLAADGAPDFATLLQRLDDGISLVHVLTTEHGSAALLTTAGSGAPAVLFVDAFRTAELRALLDDSSDGLIAAASGAGRRSLDGVLGDAWPILETLVSPIVHHLEEAGVRRAVWVPVGRLSLLPLATASGMTAGRLPSARLLGRGDGETAASPRLLAVGWPGGGERRLPAVGSEIERVAECFPVQRRRVLLAEQATWEALRAALPGSDVLHVASHGRFDADEPLDAEIELAAGETLSMRQVLDGEIDLSTCRLAVLSACETGLAEYRHLADEALGFSAVFLFAGVRTVVASLWQVDDLATMLLLSRFYRLLVDDGKGPGEALAAARRWLRTSTSRQLGLEDLCAEILRQPLQRREEALLYRWWRYAQSRPDDRPFANPAHWAGFTLSGSLV